MKVNAKQYTNVEVELDKKTIDMVTRKRLLKLIGLEEYSAEPNHRYGLKIKDGYIIFWLEERDGHEDNERIIRPATKFDESVFEILHKLWY